MGASQFYHFVPYQEDINAALQKLRQDVFASGNYHKVDHSEWRNKTEEEILRQLGGDVASGMNRSIYLDWLEIKNLPEPDTIERLLDWNGEEGTHSILDMCAGVSENPEYCTVSPLTDEQLVAYFGTTTPTREQIEAWFEQGNHNFARRTLQGLYIIIYADDAPTEICFTGFSGD
ncbi:MAG: hypothetical protein AAFV33_27075 [Chloroflexota bacterium]